MVLIKIILGELILDSKFQPLSIYVVYLENLHILGMLTFIAQFMYFHRLKAL